jgi:hypothetical protein
MQRKVKTAFFDQELDARVAQQNIFEKKQKCEFVYIEGRIRLP